MHPTAARANRSNVQSSIPSTSTPSSLLHPQQQILYGPIANPTLIQPCASGLHPSCIYPAAQRNAAIANPVPLHVQGKGNRWPPKTKHPRNQQEYCHQQQQQLSYNPKPLLLYDQTSSNPPSAPTTSFLIASSTYTHGSFSHADHQYANPSVLIPQPYFKPPELPAFCLVQDRNHPQQAQEANNYYNACNLQTLNTNANPFQFPNLNPYAATNFTPHVQNVFPNHHANLIFGGLQREKNAEISPLRSKNKPQGECYNNDWPICSSNTANLSYNVKSGSDSLDNHENPAGARNNVQNGGEKVEEQYSDESSSFDFTIEAEKMVSALCNISNEACKEDAIKKEKSAGTPLFSGAGDTASNKNNWFADFCSQDYANGKTIAIQTDGPCLDRSQFPEVLRKTIFWGCSEAELVLNASSKSDSRSSRLKNLSTATKMAVSKSATCFPIFAGDRIFVNDLINCLIRISNGWLILDNYLNKQHYPSLIDKYDDELVRCFRFWEEGTQELLNKLIETFVKLEGNSDSVDTSKEARGEHLAASFPGDVTMYTSSDLFEACRDKTESKRKQDGGVANLNARFGICAQKESKLRSKWTVTENLTALEASKSASEGFTVQQDGNHKFKGRGIGLVSNRSEAQSLNAEFFHLRSKVLTESSQEACRQWLQKEKKQEYTENKFNCAPNRENDAIFKLNENCNAGFNNQKCLSHVESSFLNSPINTESVYYVAENEPNDHFYPAYASYDYGSRKSYDNSKAGQVNADLLYTGNKNTAQLELAAVPRDKITLLSQIEPSVPEKSSEEMAANLSAWFASMRNSGNRQENIILRSDAPRTQLSKNVDLSNCLRQLQMDANRQFQTLQSMQNSQSSWNSYNNAPNSRVQVQQLQQVQEEYDSSEDVRVYMKPGSYNVPKKRHQRRSNRRLEGCGNRNANNAATHKNYGGKEKFAAPAASTPNSNIVNSNNCPAMFPATPIVPPPAFSLENSPRILKREENYAISEDVTWKAACASAEILLEALNVKDDGFKRGGEASDGKEEGEEEIKGEKEGGMEMEAGMERKLLEEDGNFAKGLKEVNNDESVDANGGVSSYEASEDDSGSTNQFSPNRSVNEGSKMEDKLNGSGKMNVKTDSWLIKTLNNVNLASKQKRRKSANSDRHSSESSNSSTIETNSQIPLVSLITNSASLVTTVATTATVKNLQQTVRSQSCSRNEQNSEDAERIVGKATYSETVRRCALSASFSERKEFCKRGKLNIANVSAICSTVIPIPGRKCQRKDLEKSYCLLHNKSRKNCGKKGTKIGVESQTEANSKSSCSTQRGRKRENASCVEFLEGKFGGKNDRGWSVWYSSKRKQSLSPLALSKLEMIHRTVWQMDEAEIFKCPSSAGNNANGNRSSTRTIEDYCKVIKSPMFLETVEYKLKNRVYHKVEHVVRDFRRIVYNSKLYHKDDHDRVKVIDTLSKKLEELFEEHFASWDFDNISGSPRESSPVLHRFKTSGQKPVTGRYGNAKKSPSSSSTVNENA